MEVAASPAVIARGVLALVVLAAAHAPARAEPAQRFDGLLVVLHGDDAAAASALADWRAAASAAHLALFAPQCPRELGCDGSWWRWALDDRHDPHWLVEQIAAAAASAHVTRVYLAGYSGGASYLASWAPAHPQIARAVAYVSGGYVATDACPARTLRALVIVGDDDDMRDAYVLPFARWLAGCAHADVTTRIVPHLGHREMHRALRVKLARDVIAWLRAEPT